MAENACLFCKIAAHEVPAAVVAEDDHTLAFLDIHPRAPGHTMVVPKVHAATLLDLPDAEVAPLLLMTKELDGRLIKALGADGLTVGINQGAASGQEVQHLHVHLLPRFASDRGGSIQSVVNNPSSASIEEMVEKIKNA